MLTHPCCAHKCQPRIMQVFCHNRSKRFAGCKAWKIWFYSYGLGYFSLSSVLQKKGLNRSWTFMKLFKQVLIGKNTKWPTWVMIHNVVGGIVILATSQLFAEIADCKAWESRARVNTRGLHGNLRLTYGMKFIGFLSTTQWCHRFERWDSDFFARGISCKVTSGWVGWLLHGIFYLAPFTICSCGTHDKEQFLCWYIVNGAGFAVVRDTQVVWQSKL